MFCKNCGQQINEVEKFCKNCGTEMVRLKPISRTPEWLKKPRVVIMITTISLFLVIIIALYFYGANLNDPNNTYKVGEAPWEKPTELSFADKIRPVNSTQDQISSSIVNIICPDGDNRSGGSGTIISSDGAILTNAHIIPQDKEGNPTIDTCVITLPDYQGKIKEVYFGKPTLIPYLSNRYDLAFITINGVYTDDDGMSHGQYPNTFPEFLGCENNNPKLGEYVRVYGYPEISGGGYYLTITDGVVSSLPNDGTIFTSAKINHGSSGGLAVDGNGCMIGIPSMISGDENESLGVLISNEIILEFIDKLNSLQDLLN